MNVKIVQLGGCIMDLPELPVAAGSFAPVRKHDAGMLRPVICRFPVDAMSGLIQILVERQKVGLGALTVVDRFEVLPVEKITAGASGRANDLVLDAPLSLGRRSTAEGDAPVLARALVDV